MTTIPTDEQIDRMIARRERLTNRRDERINFPAVNEIDDRLRLVEPGQHSDVDRLLGRNCAKQGQTIVVDPWRLTDDEKREIEHYALNHRRSDALRTPTDPLIDAVIDWRQEWMKPQPDACQQEAYNQYHAALQAWREARLAR